MRCRRSTCSVADTRSSRTLTAASAPGRRTLPRDSGLACVCAMGARTSWWKGRVRMAEIEPSIEDALKRLEEIADKLEDPELDLDQAVRLYEEGLRLYERCAKKLDAAELKITQLGEAWQRQAKS